MTVCAYHVFGELVEPTVLASFPHVQVNYRESISRIADIQYTHKKQSGGSGQFAAISVKCVSKRPHLANCVGVCERKVGSLHCSSY